MKRNGSIIYLLIAAGLILFANIVAASAANDMTRSGVDPMAGRMEGVAFYSDGPIIVTDLNFVISGPIEISLDHNMPMHKIYGEIRGVTFEIHDDVVISRDEYLSDADSAANITVSQVEIRELGAVDLEAPDYEVLDYYEVQLDDIISDEDTADIDWQDLYPYILWDLEQRKAIYGGKIVIVELEDDGEFKKVPVLVSENPYVVDRQNPFTLLQAFENNGFTLDRIDNIQLSVLPEGGSVTVRDAAAIQAVWETLPALKVTAQGARQVSINETKSIYVDIQFANPNEHVGIEMFGHVYVLGHGPFIFTDGFSEQPFIDLFYEFF